MQLQLTTAITSELEATQANMKPATIVDLLSLAQKRDFDDNESTYKTKDVFILNQSLNAAHSFNSLSSVASRSPRGSGQVYRPVIPVHSHQKTLAAYRE